MSRGVETVDRRRSPARDRVSAMIIIIRIREDPMVGCGVRRPEERPMGVPEENWLTISRKDVNMANILPRDMWLIF